MIKVAIVSGTGYTGVELLRLLAQHPKADLRAITSRKEAGTKVADMFPSLRGRYDLAFSDAADAELRTCDVVFFATPHGVAMAQARELIGAGVRIIDLAADFRLADPGLFERWYKMPHACTDLLAEAVYGIPEINREAIRKARIVGNPGCYPTAVQLGFLPLLEAGLVDSDHLIADCKSGVSGAGRKAELNLTFSDVMPMGSSPDTRSVRASNMLRIAVHRPEGTDLAMVLAAEDNLGKGAAGQAIQNMNLMFGLPETMGLTALPVVP